MDTRSRQTLRRSPRLLSSERTDKVSSQQPIDGKESVETHLGSLSKMSMKPDSKSRTRVGSHQTPLRRSTRLLPPEKLRPVEIHSGPPCITSKSKEADSSRKIGAAKCGKHQLNLSRSKSGVVLEKTQSGPRRSLRLASQTERKVSEIPQEFPDGKPRQQSMRLLEVAPVSAKNVKVRIAHPIASDEREHEKPLEVDCKVVAAMRYMELVSVTKGAGKEWDDFQGKEWNEPEAIAKSNPSIIPKKECKPMSSQIRRSSHRIMAASNGGVTLEMTDKGVEVDEMLNADRENLVLESRIKDGFVITKKVGLHKAKRRKREEDNRVEKKIEKLENEECTVAWTNEQEEALQKAYLMAKPSPHFWKKVSRMVAGKSAQECFDKIHASIVTPLSPQPRSRTRKKNLSPIANFNLSAKNLAYASEIEAGRLRRCRTKKLAAQKTVRHLLRKHCLADQSKPADHFSLLESSSPINMPVNVLNNNSNSLLSQQPGEKLSANPKMFSRFKLLASADGPSPQVLKRIKNRALHDRYIDQLHHREARRVILAKKSKCDDDLGNIKCFSKTEHSALKAARTALISDAKSFINHFQQSLANPMDELDTDCSDDDYDFSDLDE